MGLFVWTWLGTPPLTCPARLAATFVKGELSLSPHRGATLVLTAQVSVCSCRLWGLRSSDVSVILWLSLLRTIPYRVASLPSGLYSRRQYFDIRRCVTWASAS